MVRYKELHIPAPCKIHFESLPYDPHKRPCDVCEKPVYDFRNKDEAYFNRIWKKHKGDFCGAFRQDQFTEQSLSANQSFFSLTTLRSFFLSMFIGLWTMVTKAQDQEMHVTRTEIELSDTTIDETNVPSFTVVTKDCKTCLDEVHILISINGIRYTKEYITVTDSSIITLPSTIKPTDVITIEGTKRVRHRGWFDKVNKTHQQSFQFGKRTVVEIKATAKMKIRLFYKRDWVGCPKFR